MFKYHQKRKRQYFGHVIRRDNLQRLLMQGRINGRRGHVGDRKQNGRVTSKNGQKYPYNDCIKVAQDRERWKSMTADLLTTDGTQ